jgi:hypothetical protein
MLRKIIGPETTGGVRKFYNEKHYKTLVGRPRVEELD